MQNQHASVTDQGVTNTAFVSEEVTLENGNAVQHSSLEQEKRKEMLYDIEDLVSWPLSIFLGFQHFLTMIGGLISIPIIITASLCIADDDPVKGQFVSTIIFVSGMVTFLQTTLGIRLPIIQGGTFSFITPTLVILNTVFTPCENLALGNMTDQAREEIWKTRIREVQGSIILACCMESVVSITGLVGFLVQWITPLAITPTITLIGLSLFPMAAERAAGNWLVSLVTILLLILCSQYLVKIQTPIPIYQKDKGVRFSKFPVFQTFPILIGICCAWLFCIVLTESGALAEDSPARTDLKYNLIVESPWFFIPYPFPYGLPTFSAAGFIGMMSGAFASIIESVGDYHACAKICGSPPPPCHAVNRGLFLEGIGGILAGIWGTGNGTTSYSENIGALRITKVANRRVTQAAGILMIIFGVFGKFGALCATIPDPLVGGLFIVMFSMITAVGLSNLQTVDLNSSRNIFILGFSIFFGLALPGWVEANNGALSTGSSSVDQVLQTLLSSSMLIGGFLGFLLDNTIPGTLEERGLSKQKGQKGSDVITDNSIYDLPFGMEFFRRIKWLRYLPISPTYKM